MLFGQTTKLPIYQLNYSGSLSDTSTLEHTIKRFQALFGVTDDTFIMDKAFYSQKNLNLFLSKKTKFLVSVPFTNSFAKDQVRGEQKDIDTLQNVILTSSEPIRGVHKLRAWGNRGVKLHTHIYYDPKCVLEARNELFALIAKLKEVVATGVDLKLYCSAVGKYLIVRRSKQAECGYTLKVRDDVVAAELATCGWLVLVSNYFVDPQLALDVYRLRDVVEKGFWQYKCNLGFDRLRVHSDLRAENKLFVAFVALILSCYVHNVMAEKCLYERFTFDELFLVLAKLKSVCIGGQHILRPLTRQQKDLFEAFDIPLPVG